MSSEGFIRQVAHEFLVRPEDGEHQSAHHYLSRLETLSPDKTHSVRSNTHSGEFVSSLMAKSARHTHMYCAVASGPAARLIDLQEIHPRWQLIGNMLKLHASARVRTFNSITPRSPFPRCPHKSPILVCVGRKKCIALLIRIFHVPSLGEQCYVMCKCLPYHYSQKRCPYLGLRVVDKISMTYHILPVERVIRRVRLVPAAHLGQHVYYVAGRVAFSRYQSTFVPKQPSHRPMQGREYVMMSPQFLFLTISFRIAAHTVLSSPLKGFLR